MATNPYFSASGVPTQRSNGVSNVIRQEIANIALAFDKLPAFSGNLGKLVAIGATSLVASGAITETGDDVAFAGDVSIVGALATQGNNALGNAQADTLSVSGNLIKSANGNWTLPAAASGDTLNVAALAGNFGVVQAQAMAGSTAKWQLRNTSGAASSAAQFSVEVGGASAADPVYQALVSGGSTWTFGVDNSQSDAFKWAAASALSDTAILALETDGRIWGSSLHNNAGSVSGITKQFVGLSGTYTPVTSNLVGITTASPADAIWTRTGNAIEVSGWVDVNPASPGGLTFDMTLPISNGANFTGFEGSAVVTCIGNTIEQNHANAFIKSGAANLVSFLLGVITDENKRVNYKITYTLTS